MTKRESESDENFRNWIMKNWGDFTPESDEVTFPEFSARNENIRYRAGKTDPGMISLT